MSAKLDHFPIVVGVDGSPAAMGAADWAAGLANKLGMSLRILHAVPEVGYFASDAGVAMPVEAMARLREEGQEIVRAAQDEVTALYPDLTTTTDVVVEAPATALLDASALARIVVVGTARNTAISTAVLGSTALRVATHASCPVVVWRGDVKAPDQRPIVVGVDGSPESVAAVGAAFEFASLFEAPVTVVHAWSTRRQPGDVTIPFLIDWDAAERAERKLASNVVAPFIARYPKVVVDEVVDEATPSELLLSCSHASQLVVVGNRGRGRIAAALLGSTCANLLHNSSVPTMICRDTPRTDDYSW